MASTSPPGSFNYVVLKAEYFKNRTHEVVDRYFWDSRWASTPLRELIRAYREYWLCVKGTGKQNGFIPDLEIYTINLFPGKVTWIPKHYNTIIDRIWSTIQYENLCYDKKIADTATDYLYLVQELMRVLRDISKISGLSDANIKAIIDKILNRQARSVADTGEFKKYKDLIENQFTISKLITIDRDDNIVISEYDYSRSTIKKLINDGYQKGLQALITEPTRFVDLTIECGIIDGRITKILSTPDSKKVQSAFEEAVGHIRIKEQLSQLKNVKSFVEWCRMSDKEPHEIISEISDKTIEYIREYVKLLYGNSFLLDINNSIRRDYASNTQHFAQYDKNITLEPLEIFVELTRFDNGIRASNVRLTFKVVTDVNIKSVITDFSEDTKIYLRDVKSNLKLWVSGISNANLFEPIFLSEEKFELDKLFIFSPQRTPNVWIKDHKSTEPLIKGFEYDLMINVGMKGYDAISSTDPNFVQKIGGKSDGIEITVSIVGNTFDISPNTMTLKLPKQGDSDPIGFKINPRQSGTHKLRLYFYYKLNLIMMLSVSLEIKEKISSIIASFEKEQHFLNVDVIGSSDIGFESILQLERSRHG